MTRSGFWQAAAIDVTDNDEVFVAKIQKQLQLQQSK